MSEDKKSPVYAAFEALEAAPGSTAEQLAEETSLGVSTVRKALAQLESEGKTTRKAGGREAGRKLPDTWSIAVLESAPDQAKSAARPPKGKLGGLIIEHLKSCPGQALSPSAVGKAIGHSAGAISNSLAKLAEEGEVQEVSSKPKRYSISA